MQTRIGAHPRAANIPRARNRGLSRISCMRNDTSLQRRCRSDARCRNRLGRPLALHLDVVSGAAARRCRRVSARQSMARQHLERLGDARRRHLQHRAQFLGKAGGDDVIDRCPSRCRRPQWPAKAISSTRRAAGRRPSGHGRRAASRDPSVRATRQTTRASSCGAVEIRRLAAALQCAPAPSSAAQPILARAQIDQQQARGLRQIQFWRQAWRAHRARAQTRRRSATPARSPNDRRRRRARRFSWTASPCRPEW